MAGKIEKIGSTDKPDRLKIFTQVAMKRIRDYGLPGLAVREPDYAKLETAMKGGKPTAFAIRFANEKFIAEASCGGTVLTMAALDVAKEADHGKRREMIKAIHDRGDLVSGADLAAWDKKNPDPIKLAALKGDVENLKKQVENAGKGITRAKNFNAMKDNEREYLFRNWMNAKGYGEYVDFLNEHKYGRDAKDLVEAYLAENATSKKLAISDATRKAAVDAVAQNKKPDLAKAVKEPTEKVDKLVPAYYDDIAKKTKANLPALKKLLAERVAALKAMTGK